MLTQIILATLAVSLISLVGVLVIFKNQHKKSFLKILVSLAAGALLTVSFLDLLPEAIEAEHYDPHVIFSITLGSILFFFLLERVFHWHHCHCEEHGEPREQKKHLIAVNLIGDAIHNFVDGALIASAFLVDWSAGVLVTIAVILHEIPQEITDFGVLLYAGLTRAKAILYNILIALTAIIGALAFYYFGSQLEQIITIVIAIAAGNFIYLATADLIPELHHDKERKSIFYHSLWLLVGVAVIYLVSQIIPHGH